MTTHLQDLGSGWQFRSAGDDDDDEAAWRPAQIPGCVHTDLLRAGLIPDPFYGRNESGLQWIEERDWEYRLHFNAGPALLGCEHLNLVCEGLDTVATLRFNGEIILENDNMFHRHKIAVKQKLRPGENTLEIRFGSAMEYIRTHRTGHVVREWNDPIGNSTRIRKQPCQFGWDWGPRFVTCGVWRPIYLEGWSDNSIESVRIEQRHAPDLVELTFLPRLALAAGNASSSYRASLSYDGEVVAVGEFAAPDFKLPIENPRLWWPAGQGAQPLYDLTVELLQDGAPISRWSRRIGLRTITLDREPDAFEVRNKQGQTINRFGFRVNGRLIFSKGANWIPAHSFVAGLTRDDYAPLLRAATDAHMNMIRVWGGGIYEHDAFYDLCDELGLLVWQDFMFACSLYPSDDAFLASVAREARDQVTRVRHHASLALWSGNNEIVSLGGTPLTDDDRLREGYGKLFLETLPRVLREEDPQTSYVHSSPCYRVAGLPGSEASSQDEHDWDVWHARSPVEHYETTRHRFVSEFGMQSYPSPRLAATFCPPEELNILSPVFEAHQKNAAGNAIIFHYLAQLFRYPGDYRTLSYLSQINQAHCMKFAIEHFRRQQPQCLGALYWQFNDCWPVASWSSLEFGGNWKALHYYARRFFAPALVSIKLDGEEKAGIGNYTRNTRGKLELWMVSDAPDTRPAELSWELLTLDGESLAHGTETTLLRPGEAVLRQTLDFTAELSRIGKDNALFSAWLTDAETGEKLSCDVALFTAPRFLRLSRKPIEVSQVVVLPQVLRLTLAAPVFHYAVCIESDGIAELSDNFFHLCPGETKEITIRYASVEPADGSRGAPRVSSLVDTY